MNQKNKHTKGTFSAHRRSAARFILVALIAVMIIGPAEASTWKPTALVNTEAFQSIDDADTTANVVLKFGDTLAKTLTYNRTSTRFEFNDHVYVNGNLTTTGTLSGAYVHAEKTLSSSGTLVFEGAASGSSLYLGTSLAGAGLSSCSNTTNDKLLYNSATGRFSCGSDQTGAGPGGGMTQTAADERYVQIQGDTMTGALTLNITTTQSTSGALTILQRTHSTGAFIDSDTDREAAVAIDAAGTSVAPHLLFGYQGTFDTNLFRSASNTLKTNDALEVDGNLTFGDAISDAITVNAAAWTFANDTNFALSGGVNGLSFDTDTFSVDAENNRIGINTTAPKTRLEVVGTISGSLIRASNMTVSGAIVYSSGNTLMQNAKGQSGQLLIAQGTNAPQWKDPGGGMIWYFDSTQAVATSKGPQITMPIALTLSGISLKAKGAPTGAALIYDINKDGVSIFSTRPQIDAAATTGGTNAVFSTTVLPANSLLTIDIDQVGSTFAGSGVTIILKGIRRY